MRDDVGYRHWHNRRYLNLDHSGRAWQWKPDGSWLRSTVDSAFASAATLPAWRPPVCWSTIPAFFRNLR